MRAQTQLSEIDALSDQGHAWLAQNWGTAPLPVLEDQLGPMAAAALEQARIRFGRLTSPRPNLADLEYGVAHPGALALWAESLSTTALPGLAGALRSVARQVRGAPRTRLHGALESRVAGGDGRERVVAWAALPAPRRQSLLASETAGALVCSGIEGLSREGIAVPDLGSALVSDVDHLRALAPRLVGRDATLSQARIAAATLDVAAYSLGASSAPAATLALELLPELVSHAHPSVFGPACRAAGRMATENDAVRALIFSWTGDRRVGTRRRAVAALACINPASLAAGEQVTARLKECLAQEREDPYRLTTLALVLPTALAMHPFLADELIAAVQAGPQALEACWAVARALSGLREIPLVFQNPLEHGRGLLQRALAEETSGARQYLLERACTDVSAVLDPSARKPPHRVEAVLLGSLGGIKRSETAQRAAVLLQHARDFLSQQRTFATSAAEIIRVEDAFELVSGGTLGRIASAGSVQVAAAPNCEALVASALSPLPVDFMQARQALRTTRDALDIAMMDEYAEMTVAEVTAAFFGALRATDLKQRKRLDKPIGEVVQRFVHALTTAESSGYTLGARRFAVFLALRGEAVDTVQALLRFDSSLDEAAYDTVRDALTTTIDALQRFGTEHWSDVSPLVRSLVGGQIALSNAFEELDALRALLEHGKAPTTVRPRLSVSVRLAALRVEFARCLADPLYAFGVRDQTDHVAADATLGCLHAPLCVLEALAKRLVDGGLQYEELATLGKGGMGEAILVRDRSSQRLYVQKRLLSPGGGGCDRMRSTIRREWDATRHAYHPNVINVHGIEERDGAAYVIFDYIVGPDLEKFVASRPLGLLEARRVFGDVIAGVAYLHQRATVHRDIKPANVMLALDVDGEGTRYSYAESHRDKSIQHVVIVDFGIWGEAGVAPQVPACTPEYASAEQLGSAIATPEQDIFAIGALAFHALTGSPLDQHLEGVLPLIANRCARATVRDPENRRKLDAAGQTAWLEWIAAATAPQPEDRPTLERLRQHMP